MRIAVVASALLHLALIVVTMIAWPGFTSVPPTEIPRSIPFELVRIADTTNLKAQVKEREPEPPKEEDEPEQPKPEEPKPERVVPPKPEAEPEPAKPEPEPEPAPPEPPKEEPKPKPEPPKEEPKPKPEPPKEKPKPEPPKPKRVPQPDVQTAKEDEDPLDQMAALLDKRPDDDQQERVFHEEGKEPELGELKIDSVGEGDDMTVSAIDALKPQIVPCWSPDTGKLNAGDLVIEMLVKFNPDGTLRPGEGNPFVKNQARYATDARFQAAANDAIRAIRVCGTNGYKLPPNTSEVTLIFDPGKGM